MNSPSENNDDMEEQLQRAIEIVAEDFESPLKPVKGMSDREIIWEMANSGYGCPDLSALRVTGSIENWNDFNNQMEEEKNLARNAGHILNVHTNYKHLPKFQLLVLNLEKSALNGKVTKRVRNLGDIGIDGSQNLPHHEVDVAELVKAIRAAG